jgi:hypothetical protein
MMSSSSFRWLRSRERLSPRALSDQTPGSASFWSISESDFVRAASSKITPNVAGATPEVLVSLEELFDHLDTPQSSVVSLQSVIRKQEAV